MALLRIALGRRQHYNKPVIEITPPRGALLDNRLVPDTRKAVELFMAHLPDAALPDISKVLLYGSRARGDHRADSDIDLAIVLPGADPDDGTLFKLLMRLAVVSSRIMVKMDYPMDVEAIIVWEDELLEPEKQYNPDFYRSVLADGIEIRVIR